MLIDQKILRDRAILDWLIDTGKALLKPCAGLKLSRGIWRHITGTDLVRAGDAVIYVLESNLRSRNNCHRDAKASRINTSCAPARCGNLRRSGRACREGRGAP